MENEKDINGCGPTGCAGCAGCGSDNTKETENLSEFSPVITLTDDEGKDAKFEILDVVVIEEKEYLVVAEVQEEEAEENIEVVILEITEEDGEEVYDTVVDDELAKKVFDEFVKQQEELEDDEEETESK